MGVGFGIVSGPSEIVYTSEIVYMSEAQAVRLWIKG